MWYGSDPWVHMPLCQSRCFPLSLLKKRNATQKVIIIDSFSFSHLSISLLPLTSFAADATIPVFCSTRCPYQKTNTGSFNQNGNLAPLHYHHHVSSHFPALTLAQVDWNERPFSSCSPVTCRVNNHALTRHVSLCFWVFLHIPNPVRHISKTDAYKVKANNSPRLWSTGRGTPAPPPPSFTSRHRIALQ